MAATGRCFGDGDPIYERYHDEEWGFPTLDERALFELLTLEAFQAGLSWRLILGRREAFREAFSDFEPDSIVRFGPENVERLLSNQGIIRNRAKILATIENARATVALRAAGEPLAELMKSHVSPRQTPPESWADVQPTTPEAVSLAGELKRRGFHFLGPTTVYSLMQASGLVDDHLASCPVRPAAERARRAAGLI
jgi:DNA-3-methyladenine glycosylase I